MSTWKWHAARLALCAFTLALTACGDEGGSQPDVEVGGGDSGSGGSGGGGGNGDLGDDPAAPLAIFAQPQPTFSEAGVPARFAVAATGPAGLSFQWQRASAADASTFVDIPAATGARLTLAAPQTADDGALYRVVVRSGAQSVTSAAVALQVVASWQGVARPTVSAEDDHTPAALTVDARGRVLAVGTVDSGVGTHGLALQQAADGSDRRWGFTYGNGEDVAFVDVASEAAGDVYVVGRSDVPVGGSSMAIAGGVDAVLLKLSGDDGRVLWARSLGSGFRDEATAVAVDATGAVYVAGFAGGLLPGAQSHAGGFDAFLAKYSADGARLWVRQFGFELDDGYVDEDRGLAPREVEGPAIHMALDATGRPVVALTGQFGVVGQNNDVFVRRFDADGGDAGAEVGFDLRRNDRVARVAVTPAGEVVIAGVTEGEVPDDSGGFQQDVFVLRLDASLREVSRTIQALDPQSHLVDALVTGLAVDAAGNAYVAAHAELFSGSRGVAWLKVDRQGTVLWMESISGDIESGGITVDPMGRLFLAHQDDGIVVRRLRPDDGLDHP